MQNRDEYLDTVCEQIRFRAARKTIRGELDAHIDDRIAEGKSEAEAIAAMGDAAQTGKALNSIHRPRLEWRVILCMLLLSAVSAYLAVNMTGYGSNLYMDFHYGVIRHMIIGFAIMLGLYFLNYTYLVKLRYVLFGAAIIYIGIYLIAFDSTYHGGDYGTLLFFTPVIICSSLLLILSNIGFISHRWKKQNAGLAVTSSLSIASIVALYLIDSDYAMLLTIINITVFAVLRWKQTKKNWIEIGVYFGLMVIVLCYLLVRKIISESGLSQNHDQVMRILNTAKLTGASDYYINGNGMTLESSRIYYIITAIIAAYGWLPGIALAAVYCVLGAVMLRRSLKITHTLGRMLSAGITVYFLVRIILHLCANMGLMGGYYSLPFLSYARYEYLADAALMGVFLSVWRRSTYMKDEAKEKTLIKQATVSAE